MNDTQNPQKTSDDRLPGYVRYFQAQSMQMPEALHRALAAELSSRFSPSYLRSWTRLLGAQWAQQASEAYAHAEDLGALNDALNQYLAHARWGWAQLSESERGLTVNHQGAPLPQGLGIENLCWTSGLLEGFYETVFRHFGAGDDLKFNLAHASQDGFDLHFQLGS